MLLLLFIGCSLYYALLCCYYCLLDVELIIYIYLFFFCLVYFCMIHTLCYLPISLHEFTPQWLMVCNYASCFSPDTPVSVAIWWGCGGAFVETVKNSGESCSIVKRKTVLDLQKMACKK